MLQHEEACATQLMVFHLEQSYLTGSLPEVCNSLAQVWSLNVVIDLWNGCLVCEAFAYSLDVLKSLVLLSQALQSWYIWQFKMQVSCRNWLLPRDSVLAFNLQVADYKVVALPTQWLRLLHLRHVSCNWHYVCISQYFALPLTNVLEQFSTAVLLMNWSHSRMLNLTCWKGYTFLLCTSPSFTLHGNFQLHTKALGSLAGK